MGTRADLYLGRGPDAEWLGSIAWDGYPDGMPEALLRCDTVDRFKVLVEGFLAGREDATLPEQGWPWPWDDSRTTDYAYAFDGDNVWASNFGRNWFDARFPEPDDDEEAERLGTQLIEGEISMDEYRDAKPAVFPDMAERKNVTYGKRSGVLLLGATEDGRVGIVGED